MSETTIYCFIRGTWGSDFSVCSAYVDGDKLNMLAGHVSSTIDYAKGDIGYTESGMGEHKHKIYKDKFPKGYKLEWVDDFTKHPILKTFLEKKENE